MSDLIRTLNTADRLFTLWWMSRITYLEMAERITDLGCYNVTPSAFTFEGVTYTFRSTL